jgi:hypothetical protein
LKTLKNSKRNCKIFDSVTCRSFNSAMSKLFKPLADARGSVVFPKFHRNIFAKRYSDRYATIAVWDAAFSA